MPSIEVVKLHSCMHSTATIDPFSEMLINTDSTKLEFYFKIRLTIYAKTEIEIFLVFFKRDTEQVNDKYSLSSFHYH